MTKAQHVRFSTFYLNTQLKATEGNGCQCLPENANWTAFHDQPLRAGDTNENGKSL